MTPLTAQQTLDRARTVLGTGAAAGLPELLELIETLSTDIFKVNLDELAELIEKDTTVLAKVITVANTLAHNPGIAPVATITQAIHHVGFHRIRSLAVSLMLIENTGGPRNPPEQRDAAAHALASGLFAESCATQLGTLEPDLAFATATLRNFGSILLPAVSLDHARAARTAQKTKSADAACRAHFGVTPVELSRRLLASARLPDEVARALRDCEPAALGGTATQFDTRLLAVAEFGRRLAGHALDPGISSEVFASRSRQTARDFDRLLPGAADLIEPAVLQTGERLQTFLRATGAGSLPTRSLQRLREHVRHYADRRAAALAAASRPSEPAESAPPPDMVATPAESPPAGELPSPSGLAATLQAWDETLAAPDSAAEAHVPAPVASLSDRLVLARDELQADACWIFRPLSGGASFSLTDGAGSVWQHAQRSAAIRPSDRNVFGVCLSRSEVVVLHDTADSVIAPYLPGWWSLLDQPPRSLALVPLRDGTTVAGLVLLGWQRARRVVLTPIQVARVQFLCLPDRDSLPSPSTLAA